MLPVPGCGEGEAGSPVSVVSLPARGRPPPAGRHQPRWQAAEGSEAAGGAALGYSAAASHGDSLPIPRPVSWESSCCRAAGSSSRRRATHPSASSARRSTSVQSWPLERPEPGSRSTAGCCCPARGLSTVGLLEWPRALRRRGFIGDHSDAIRLRTPDGLCRLIGRRACVEDHLRPVTGGTDRSRCRRLGSPQSSREVPAETQEEPAGTGRGTGTQRKDRWSGGRRPRGGRREPGGRSGRWRCRSGARSPTACDPSASLPRPAPSRPERAWPFAYPARSSAGPPPTSTRRAPCSRQGQARCAHPFGTLDGGRSGALGVVEGQGELRAGQPGCARSLCRDVFWRGQALLDEPGLQAGDGAVLQGQLAAVARDLLGWPVIQR